MDSTRGRRFSLRLKKSVGSEVTAAINNSVNTCTPEKTSNKEAGDKLSFKNTSSGIGGNKRQKLSDAITPIAGSSSSFSNNEESFQLLNIESKALDYKKYTVPSDLKFGFLGLGTVGTAFVTNLLKTGHKVVVWNQSSEKYSLLKEIGAEVAQTPSDVIIEADVTFSCAPDVKSAKELVFGNDGVLSEMDSNKSYVEMSAIDAGTSQEIGEAITTKGGKYLEVRLEGPQAHLGSGDINIMASGDQSVFNDCSSSFDACGKNVLYLGDIGKAPKMFLVYQTILGVSIGGLAEVMKLSEHLDVDQSILQEMVEKTKFDSSQVINNIKAMAKLEVSTKNYTLGYLLKNLQLAQGLADSLDHPTPLLPIAKDAFVNAKILGYGDQDASAIIFNTKKNNNHVYFQRFDAD